MPKTTKLTNKQTNKSAGFVAAAGAAAVKTVADRPNFIVRALRWIFITAPRAIWNWICSIEIGGLCNLAMLLLIIVLFSVLIGQVVSMNCERRSAALPAEVPTVIVPTPAIPDNVDVTEKSAAARPVAARDAEAEAQPAEQKRIVLPMKTGAESAKVKLPMKKPGVPKVTVIDGDLIIDGDVIGERLCGLTQVNGNLILQNMRTFTLPCGIKVNGNLIVRGVRVLNFCGGFTVNGDIYVSADSSFGPIPRNARVRGQIIF
ncbi:MAG: hypothetical protein FWF97_03885 [Alphaproteobacteria bacterium]|nr:hypothetical protein [Alphaproteobacteria bacterium]